MDATRQDPPQDDLAQDDSAQGDSAQDDLTQNLTVTNNTEAQRFEAPLGAARAVAEYHLKNDVIIFTHTEVPEAIEGKGVAGKLIQAALDAARAEHYQVVPLCPFVAAYIRRHREYQDLVLPRFRYMVG